MVRNYVEILFTNGDRFKAVEEAANEEATKVYDRIKRRLEDSNYEFIEIRKNGEDHIFPKHLIRTVKKGITVEL